MAPTKNPKRRPLGPVAVARQPHPSRGGSRGYSQDLRALAMRVSHDPNLAGTHQTLQQDGTRPQGLYPVKLTTYRWRRRHQLTGSWLQFRPTGNRRATVLRGSTAFRLALWKLAHPDSTAAETNAHLWSVSPPAERRLYSPSQITEAEDRLGLSRKVPSVTAFQALLPRNLAWRHDYWNMPYPLGIQGIPKDDIIDVDEAAIFLEMCVRSFAKVYIGKRSRLIGHYGHSRKYTLVMAISGGPNGERWVEFVERPGTSITDFANFINQVLTSLPAGTCKTFIMDNLTSHTNQLIRQLIHAAGHRVVFRAPYYPVDGPIEYVFNTIQQELRLRCHQINNHQDLEAAINAIIANIPDFQNYFTHCGYP